MYDGRYHVRSRPATCLPFYCYRADIRDNRECPLANNVVFSCCGVRLSSLVLQPPVPVPVLCMNMGQTWNSYRQGKIKALGKKRIGDDHGIDPGPLQTEE